MTIWIPVSFLCIVPVYELGVLVSILAFAISGIQVSSGYFLVKSITPLGDVANASAGNVFASKVVLGFMLACQLVLAFLFLFYFFNHTIQIDQNTETGSLLPTNGTVNL